MATKTPRQQKHAELTAERAKHTEERQKLDARATEIRQRMRERSEQRTVLDVRRQEAIAESARGTDDEGTIGRLGAEIAGLDAEQERDKEILASIEKHQRELSSSPLHQQHGQAAIWLRREPCERALAALADLWRQAEAQWAEAGKLALALEQQGDQWGRNELSRMGRDLERSATGEPWTIRLPAAPEVP